MDGDLRDSSEVERVRGLGFWLFRAVGAALSR